MFSEFERFDNESIEHETNECHEVPEEAGWP